MAEDDDGAAAAEAHFEALRRFVDERNLASRQQNTAQAAGGGHVPPLQVSAQDAILMGGAPEGSCALHVEDPCTARSELQQTDVEIVRS